MDSWKNEMVKEHWDKLIISDNLNHSTLASHSGYQILIIS